MRPLSEIFLPKILTVDGHEKRGAYVPSHLHSEPHVSPGRLGEMP